MNKLSPYLCLFFAALSIFMLGGYTCVTVYEVKEIELYRWFLTSAVGIFFFIIFLEDYKK